MYVRGFILSYAAVQKANLPLIIHLPAGIKPCRCSGNYPRNYSIYVKIEENSQAVSSWAAYKQASQVAAQTLEEIRLAQEKSAEFKKTKAFKH